MKYRITPNQARKIEQLMRSNYAELLAEILRGREQQLNDAFRGALPENFQEVKGRALEIDSLIEALKSKEPNGER
jgi:hypothetical protein